MVWYKTRFWLTLLDNARQLLEVVSGFLQTAVLPLEEADIQQDLRKAGVYWELSPLSLTRLRFEVIYCTLTNCL